MYCASWKKANSSFVRPAFALKVYKISDLYHIQKQQIFREIGIHSSLGTHHKHIIPFLAAFCTEDKTSIVIVLEYAEVRGKKVPKP